MGEPQDKEKIKTIIAAARKRFGHFGLAKSTMTEIATDVGLSKASLYYYFPDKEHLFLEVIRNEMEYFFSELTKINEQPIKAPEKLRAYADLRFDYFREFLNLSKLGEYHIESIKPAFAKLYQDFELREKKIVAEVFEQGIAQKDFGWLDANAHAELVAALLRGIRLVIIKERDSFLLTPEDYEKIKLQQTLFLSVFLKGISL